MGLSRPQQIFNSKNKSILEKQRISISGLHFVFFFFAKPQNSPLFEVPSSRTFAIRRRIFLASSEPPDSPSPSRNYDPRYRSPSGIPCTQPGTPDRWTGR